ncbi:MAG: hypothetical protein MUP22_00055, partial [Desulfobacterales bacterium]|nr:hypothetical protein [Desulfobacterales bacterium]
MASFYDRLIEFLLIFLIVFTPLAYGSVEPGSIAIFEITAAIMALLWFFKMIANGKFEFVRSPFIGLIFLFILYISLQLILPVISPNTVRSIYPWATKTELLKVISYALIFLVTLNTIKTKQQITRLLSVIILVGFFMGIFYLMRYFGVNAPRGFINHNHYSAYLAMIIPVSLSFCFINTSAIARMPALPRTASMERPAKQFQPQFLLFFCA